MKIGNQGIQKSVQQGNQDPKLTKGYHYQIKTGDTLSAIGKKFDVSVKDLKTANGLIGDNIQAGRHLTIPITVHKVKPGENLTSIADQYGTIHQMISHYHEKITGTKIDSKQLAIGQLILIPPKPFSKLGYLKITAANYNYDQGSLVRVSILKTKEAFNAAFPVDKGQTYNFSRQAIGKLSKEFNSDLKEIKALFEQRDDVNWPQITKLQEGPQSQKSQQQITQLKKLNQSINQKIKALSKKLNANPLTILRDAFLESGIAYQVHQEAPNLSKTGQMNGRYLELFDWNKYGSFYDVLDALPDSAADVKLIPFNEAFTADRISDMVHFLTGSQTDSFIGPKSVAKMNQLLDGHYQKAKDH